MVPSVQSPLGQPISANEDSTTHELLKKSRQLEEVQGLSDIASDSDKFEDIALNQVQLGKRKR